ncbi:MAG TPA: hypothetical protein VKH19_16560 [Gemmatimonadaceae bacterium]|nr:hypothetical protein [Gemmatimonadaceae bacterium]
MTLSRAAAVLLVVGIFACGSEEITFPKEVELSQIAVDSTANTIELGNRVTFTATAKDKKGKVVDVPVTWRTSNEKVAVFERDGVLYAKDTGQVFVAAASLGVGSPTVSIQIVWLGPAHVVSGAWSKPVAVNPGAIISDSLRVVVTNSRGQPVTNARVSFTVTQGGGTVSPILATTNNAGVAAAQWTLGPASGTNKVTASVVHDDGTPNPLVPNNAIDFAITSYAALTIQGGDNQTAQILDDVPVTPSVRLVDSLGNPRPGVPVIFTAFQNGRVTTPVVSTNASGIATPGAWTLGDIPNGQALEARVEDARVNFHATATGTPIRYRPASVSAGGVSTCALESNGAVKCWGHSPESGSGGSANTSTPTATSPPMVATSLGASSTHYCALKSGGEAWCWGVLALVDTSGAVTNTNAPMRLQSDLAWSRIAPGFAHTCALTPGQDAYCWGDNTSGQLGDLTLDNRRVPGPVAGGFRFSTISSGSNHSCALALDGTALCWGGNQTGQIGDGGTTNRTSPTTVGGGLAFQAIGSGDGFSCGLTTQGRVYCWGAFGGSQNLTPTTYASAPTFISLSVGSRHACALAGDGTAYCWGDNAYGQLGDSTISSRSAPTKVAGGMVYSQISAGLSHTCAITTDGAVACWGRNAAGELGENTSAGRTTPGLMVLGVIP